MKINRFITLVRVMQRKYDLSEERTLGYIDGTGFDRATKETIKNKIRLLGPINDTEYEVRLPEYEAME